MLPREIGQIHHFHHLPMADFMPGLRSMDKTHLGKCLSTTSMQQPRILRLLSLAAAVAMVQYLFNIGHLKLVLTRTLISSVDADVNVRKLLLQASGLLSLSRSLVFMHDHDTIRVEILRGGIYN